MTSTIPPRKSRHPSTQAPLLRKSPIDRKSTRLNSSHDQISYAVFCLKKKKKHTTLSMNLTQKRLATSLMLSHDSVRRTPIRNSTHGSFLTTPVLPHAGHLNSPCLGRC